MELPRHLVYATEPPPEPSPRLAVWLDKFRRGWKPNRRIACMGWETRCEFYGVTGWELFNVIDPAIEAVMRGERVPEK